MTLANYTRVDVPMEEAVSVLMDYIRSQGVDVPDGDVALYWSPDKLILHVFQEEPQNG